MTVDKKPGPKPDHLKIDEPFEDAVKKALQKPPPKKKAAKKRKPKRKS
jgi:hypothetical protein